MMKSQSVFALNIALIVMVVCCLSLPASAAEETDDVLTTIDQAVKQYKTGDYAGAASNLDYASQLVRQKKSERMKSLLPEPFIGWEAKEASSQALGTAVFGGGLTVRRDYFSKNNGSVSIEIVSDSPVLQSIMMMLNNPMFAGAAGGMLETIKAQRAIVKYDDKGRSGEINIVVASRFMVTVKGKGVNRNTLVKYAEAVDYVSLVKN